MSCKVKLRPVQPSAASKVIAFGESRFDVHSMWGQLKFISNEDDPKPSLSKLAMVQLEKYNHLSILSQQPVERVSGGGHLKASTNWPTPDEGRGRFGIQLNNWIEGFGQRGGR